MNTMTFIEKNNFIINHVRNGFLVNIRPLRTFWIFSIVPNHLSSVHFISFLGTNSMNGIKI